VLAFFSRIPRCVVGLKACATAHYWARKLGALGHEVRLMPAQYVKAYIKRNKHDAADAAKPVVYLHSSTKGSTDDAPACNTVN
jgi:transposase